VLLTADVTWQLIGESALQFDHALLSSASSDALLLDCSGGELYLHIGEDCADDTRAAAKDAAIAYRCARRCTLAYNIYYAVPLMSEVQRNLTFLQLQGCVVLCNRNLSIVLLRSFD
jgi:hypothetical protein